MPFTPEQKAYALQKNGFDPATHDVDDDGNVFEKQPTTLQPTVSSVPTTLKNITASEPSAAGVFGRTAVREALPTVAGGLGMSGGASLGAYIGAFGGPAAPVTIPAGAIIGGIAGAMGGSAAQHAVQNKMAEGTGTVFDPEVAAQEAAAHPWASAGGALATMPLGGFNPNIANVGKAGRTLVSKLLAPGEGVVAPVAGEINPLMQAAENANLLNVGIGAVMNPAIRVGGEVASAYREDRPININPSDLLIDAASGALFNKPNAIGRGLGFHDATIPTGLTVKKGDLTPLAQLEKLLQEEALNRQYKETPGVEVKREGEVPTKVFDPDAKAETVLYGSEHGEILNPKKIKILYKDKKSGIYTYADENGIIKEATSEKIPAGQRISKERLGAEPELTELATKAVEGEVPSQPENRFTQEGVDVKPELLDMILERKATKPQAVQKIFHGLDLNETEATHLLDLAIKKAEAKAQEIYHPNMEGRQEGNLSHEEKLNIKREIDDEHAKLVIQERDDIEFFGENSPEAKESSAKLRQFELDNAAWVGAGRRNAAEKGNTSGLPNKRPTKKGQIKNQESSTITTEVETKIKDELTKMGVSGGITPQVFAKMKALGLLRGVTLNANGELTVAGQTGGRRFVESIFENASKRIAEINPSKSGADTPIHEIFHNFFNDLKNSSSATDKDIYRRALELVSKSPEYKADVAEHQKQGETPRDAEEFLTQEQGVSILGRMLGIDQNSNSTKQWWKDLKLAAKRKWNPDNMTLAEMREYLTRKWLSDKPYEQYYKKELGAGNSKVSTSYTTKEEGEGDKSGEVNEDAQQPLRKGGEGKPVSRVFEQGESNFSRQQYTPEDLAAYNELSAKAKDKTIPLKERFDMMGKLESIRNKYDGMGPKNTSDVREQPFSKLAEEITENDKEKILSDMSDRSESLQDKEELYLQSIHDLISDEFGSVIKPETIESLMRADKDPFYLKQLEDEIEQKQGKEGLKEFLFNFKKLQELKDSRSTLWNDYDNPLQRNQPSSNLTPEELAKRRPWFKPNSKGGVREYNTNARGEGTSDNAIREQQKRKEVLGKDYSKRDTVRHTPIQEREGKGVLYELDQPNPKFKSEAETPDESPKVRTPVGVELDKIVNRLWNRYYDKPELKNLDKEEVKSHVVQDIYNTGVDISQYSNNKLPQVGRTMWRRAESYIKGKILKMQRSGDEVLQSTADTADKSIIVTGYDLAGQLEDIGAPAKLIAKAEALGLEEVDKYQWMAEHGLGSESGNQFREQPESSLTTKAEKMLKANAITYRLPFNHYGRANGEQLLNAIKNKVTPVEWDMLEKAGIKEKWSGRDVNKEDALKWIQENGPKVEVHTYGMEGNNKITTQRARVIDAERSYNTATHLMEGQGYEKVNNEGMFSGSLRRKTDGNLLLERGGVVYEYKSDGETLVKQTPIDKVYPGMAEFFLAKRQFESLGNQEPVGNQVYATTAYDTVSALPTNEPMPEWTATKSRKNVQRVDVVVPTKLKKNWRQIGNSSEFANDATGEVRSGRHFNQDKAVEDVKWRPDNLHENLPNTLGWAMIQYKTGPKGEKIAFVAEAQSRWGQELRTAKDRVKTIEEASRNDPTQYGDVMRLTPDDARRNVQNIDHPLLRDYNRLILKAAIDQARKEGATHIVVSDAETAMMTEGHDTQHLVKYMPNRVAAVQELDRLSRKYYGLDKYRYGHNIPLEVRTINGKDAVVLISTRDKLGHKEAYNEGLRPPQDPGMRLNYDTILPKIAEELTGSKGERVELGEHKNALTSTTGVEGRPNHVGQWGVEDTSTGQIGWARDRAQAERTMNFNEETRANSRLIQATESQVRGQKQRENLIFRNPDGTPKTSVTGQMFPLEIVAKRLESGDKFTLFNKYQDESALRNKQINSPEFKEWFGDSKVVDKDGKPLVVYHGNNADFSIFDKSYSGQPKPNTRIEDYMDAKEGFFFAKDPNFAAQFTRFGKLPEKPKGHIWDYNEFFEAQEAHGNIKPVYLQIKNPKQIEYDQWNLSKVAKDLREAKAEGYDGAILVPTEDYTKSEGYATDSYVAFHPEQIKSAIGNSGKFDINNPDIREQGFSSLADAIKPDIQRIKELDHPDAKVVADAFTDFYEKKDYYTGQFSNDFMDTIKKHIDWKNPKQLFTLDNEKFQHVVQRRWDIQDNGNSNIVLTPEEQQIDDALTRNLQLTLAAKNAIPTFQHQVPTPDYIPMIPSRKTMKTLLNEPGPARDKLIQDWHDYYTGTLGKTQAESEKAFETYMKAFDKKFSNLAQQFGPIDKASGLGIPRSWRETQLADIMTRFNNRYARRIAYLEAVELNPKAAAALKNPTGIQRSDMARRVMDNISGASEVDESKRMAISRLVRSGMFGPLTGAKDFTSNFTLGWQHMEPKQAIMSSVDAFKNIKDNWKASFEQGVNRNNVASLEWGEGGMDEVVQGIRRTSDIISTLQGRNALEKLTRAVAMGQGRYLIKDNLNKFYAGKLSSQGRRALEQFMPDYATNKNITQEHLDAAAARYVNSVQGTYDARGLPHVAIEGSWAPILSLARWNIEKMNNFNKHVINPMREGDFKPFLMQTLGLVIGGAMVEKLVESMTDRKSKLPTKDEIATLFREGRNTDGFTATAYKMMGMASLSGYGGMLTDLARIPMDVKFGNRPQGYENPTVWAVQSVYNHYSDLQEAVQNGDVPNVLDVTSRVLSDYVQAYRIGLSHLSEEQRKKIEDSDKFRDLKIWKVTHGGTVSGFTGDLPNPYTDKDIKDFKKTTDIGEAAKMLPSLISDALDKANGDPEVLRKLLTKIKQNNYQTMPSPTEAPHSFLNYIMWLENTEGKEEATKRLTDYFSRNAVNKVKSAMVP